MSFDLEKISQTVTDTVGKVVTGVKDAMDTEGDHPVSADQKAILALVDVVVAHNEAAIKDLKTIKASIQKNIKDNAPAVSKAENGDDSDKAADVEKKTESDAKEAKDKDKKEDSEN